MNLEGVSHCRQTHFPIQEIRTRHRFSNGLKLQNEQSIQQDVKCVVLQHLNFAFCDPHRLMLGVCWAHLGSMLGRVGPMLGHPGPMLYPHWWKSNQQIVNPHVFFWGLWAPIFCETFLPCLQMERAGHWGAKMWSGFGYEMYNIDFTKASRRLRPEGLYKAKLWAQHRPNMAQHASP